MAAGMAFGLLGPLTVHADGVAVPIAPGKQRVLLAALLFRAGRPLTTDELAELLWGSAPPPSAAATLQNYVKRLRLAFGAGRDRIVTHPGGYLIRVDAGELDVIAMEEALAAAQRAAQGGAWPEAAAKGSAALELWRGEPLSDIDSGALAAAEIPRLTELRFRARELRIEAGLQLGGPAVLVAEARQLAAEEPLREHPHALLIRALHGSGRRAEALLAYQQARNALVAELGCEPGPELQALHREILDDNPARAAVADLASTQPRPPQHRAVVPRQLPAPARHFAGRSGELAALAGLLGRVGQDRQPAVVISAISGLAGVGKTALAVQWAHQVAGEFPDGQLYVNLRGYDAAQPPMPAADAIRLALDAFQVPAAQIPASAEAQAGLYRSMLAGKKVLIVADNAADAAQVRPLLPGSPGCLVIVTSRNTLAGLVATDGAVPMSLDVLTDAEARDLLARILGPARVGAEPEAAGRLIEACGRLPLALAITAARAATRPQLPLAAVAADLAGAAGRLDALQAAGDALASVRAALACSYDQLSADAARILRLLGVHPGPDISGPAAASLAGLPGPEAARLLAELADASMTSQDGGGRCSLHDLVRLYAAEQAALIDSEAEREAATGRMLDHYLHTAYAAARLLRPAGEPISVDPPGPGTAPEQLADGQAAMCWFDAEHRALIAAADHAVTAGQEARAWGIAWTLQAYFYSRSHWHDQLAASATALAAADRLGDPALQARSHHYLGWAALWLGRYDDADSHFRHALEVFWQAEDPAWQAHVHLGLARLRYRQGQPARAARRARQALELYTAAGHEAGQADALGSLGWYLGQLGEYEEALAHGRQALALCRRAGDRQIEAGTLDGLGYACHHLGQHAEAVACYQQALAITRETDSRHQQAQVLTHLGTACHAAGDPEAARAAWREARSILDDLQYPTAAAVRAMLEAAETADTAEAAAEHH
jgi:DNA-binding SARP family transcriptional activator/Tfp pilus assembly protein PilF